MNEKKKNKIIIIITFISITNITAIIIINSVSYTLSQMSISVCCLCSVKQVGEKN